MKPAGLLPYPDTVTRAARSARTLGRYAGYVGLLVALLLSALAPARANHLIGTDWQLTPLQANQVRVRLTVYTDPVGGGSNATGDPDVTIAAYERGGGPGGTDRLVASYGLPRTGGRGIPGAGPTCGPMNVPLVELTYEAVLIFETSFYTSPNGYYLAWERCCRNQLLTNVSNGQNEPLATTLRFPAWTRTSVGPQFDAAPRFSAPPSAVALCLGEPSRVSFAATDADGDSLAYALVAPLGGFTSTGTPFLPLPNAGPYPVVRYSPGFSVQQPLAGSFQLNPRTGELTGVASQSGTYLVAVAVREYRNGVLIGENRRETELKVVVCPTNASPTLTRVLPAPPDTVVITGAADRCLTLRATDPDPGQTLTVRALDSVGVVISPSRFTIQFPPAPVEFTVCLTSCGQPGPRLLTLILSDNGCLASTPATLHIPVRVVPAPNAPPVLRREPPAPDTLVTEAGSEITFAVVATDPERGPLTVRLRPNGAPGLGPASATGTGDARLDVRWTPPCGAARPAPYALWVQANDEGCADPADSLRVLVRVTSPGPASAADLPNVITPNGDGLNDCFGVRAGGGGGACTNSFQEVLIFNRWGRRVYRSTDPAFCWDAHDAGPGTYFYSVRGTQRSVRGLLTVAR